MIRHDTLAQRRLHDQSRNTSTPNHAPVMAASLASHEKYSPLYKKLAE